MSIKKVIPIAAVILIGCAIGIGAWAIAQANRVETFTSKGVSFQYAPDYESVDASTLKNKHSETMVRLVAAKPLSIVELKHETGAIMGAKMANSNFLDTLESTAERSLPTAYKDYKKAGTKRIKVSGRDASRIDFSYTGKDKKTKLYMSLIIIPKGNDAYYAYIQSTDKSRWQHDSNQLQASLRISS